MAALARGQRPRSPQTYTLTVWPLTSHPSLTRIIVSSPSEAETGFPTSGTARLGAWTLHPPHSVGSSGPARSPSLSLPTMLQGDTGAGEAETYKPQRLTAQTGQLWLLVSQTLKPEGAVLTMAWDQRKAWQPKCFLQPLSETGSSETWGMGSHVWSRWPGALHDEKHKGSPV